MTDYAHATARELAAALHLYRRRLNPGRPKPTKTAAEIEADVQRSIELLKAGHDPHEVAAMIGISFPAMRQRLYDRSYVIGDFQ